MNSNKCILVTGAGGYIGTSLVPSLLKSGYKVRAVDRFFFGNLLPKHKSLEVIKTDVRKIPNKCFKNIYAIIDLAAISNDPSGEKFSKETIDINFKARAKICALGKKNGVDRYLLPSSCSNYGKIKKTEIADENFKLNPLTNYSKANSLAEKAVLKNSTSDYCVTIFRQGTVYGYSPKMRFDLAINGMTYGCFKNNTLNLMRDGTQRRPMLHIKDAIRAMKIFLKKDKGIINNEIFNVGGKNNNYSINDLGKKFKKYFGSDKIKVNWYGSRDNRSYFVSFDKIEKTLGFKNKYQAEDGIKELLVKLKKNKIDKTAISITLDWYEHLEFMNKFIKDVGYNKKILKF